MFLLGAFVTHELSVYHKEATGHHFRAALTSEALGMVRVSLCFLNRSLYWLFAAKANYLWHAFLMESLSILLYKRTLQHLTTFVAGEAFGVECSAICSQDL